MSVEATPGNRRTFDAQFQLHDAQFFGGIIDIVDIAPEHPTPGKLGVLFAPGWSTGPVFNKGLLRPFYERGRRILSFSHMRQGGEDIGQAYKDMVGQVTKNLHQQGTPATEINSKLQRMNERWESIQYLPQAALRRALTILALLEEKKVDKINIVNHSEGGSDAVIAAYIHPDRIDNIVSIQTSGMIGNDTVPRLMERTAVQALIERKQGGIQQLYHAEKDTFVDPRLESELEQRRLDNLSVDEARRTPFEYAAQNWRRALVYEPYAIAHAQIGLLMYTIRSEDGVGIVLMHGVEDRMFPMGRMQKTVLSDHYERIFEESGGKEVLVEETLVEAGGSVDGFISMLGTHNSLYDDPRIIYGAEAMVTQLESNKRDQR